MIPSETLMRPAWSSARGSTLAVSLALMSLVGCATSTQLYQGQVRPTAETATLKMERSFAITGANIVAGEGQLGAGSYELLPGSYDVEIRFAVPLVRSIADLSP